MSELPADATDEVVQRYARAYILVMLGSSFLSDSSGSDVSLHYLPLLADLNAISGYSWGAAVLAYLYLMLCNACESTHTNFWMCHSRPAVGLGALDYWSPKEACCPLPHQLVLILILCGF
ncbi:hypothetical protein QQ045_022523 [Rhodiola kirilowii]